MGKDTNKDDADIVSKQKLNNNTETELKSTSAAVVDDVDRENDDESLAKKTTNNSSNAKGNSSEVNGTETTNKIDNASLAADQTDTKENSEDPSAVSGETKLSEPVPKQEFKIRIVPLEKLLEKPPAAAAAAIRKKSTDTDIPKKRLPARKTRPNSSIVEISSDDTSTTDEDDSLPLKIQSKSKTRPSYSNLRVQKKDPQISSTSSSSSRRSSTSSKSKDKSTELAIRRCVVRLKRIKLPSSGNAKKANKEAAPAAPSKQVNGKRKRSIDKQSSSSESTNNRQSTSTANKGKRAAGALRKKRIMSDSAESEFDVQEETVVDEPYEESNNGDEEGNDDDEQNREKPNSSNSNSDSDAKSSASSEIIPTRKKRVFAKKKKNSSDGDSDFEQEKKPAKKRRRVKKNSSDSNESGDEDDEKQKNKRKHIRKIIKTKDLDVTTKEAHKEEEERRKRIEERQKLYNKIYEKPESTEVNELVLDFDPDTKEVILQVDKGILKKLKPHQVTGIKFMWDACFETVKDAAEKPGSGCILAHCMGLGKTLQIVALSHTLLANTKKTTIERVLIISPLSTLNNWAREFVQWMSFARKKNIEIYDMSRFKDKPTRIFKLNEWFEEGGVCILGYDMYRILANDKAKGLRKKQREQLQKALVDPGPDLVVCDEGHLLKNEKTSISKAVTKMRTRRRIVLTGTPLQNNLKEYYCMIQFIKPNLLGTYKEYMNRFVNPITNGQYTDSTERDIRLMKHRSHILHTMLEGCMQRRDYSVLAPYLPPKHEYVVYTLLSDLQQQLYEYYMTTHRDVIHSDIGGKGARLFQDFQDLRRIWTHPKNLQVNSEIVIAKRLLANEGSDLEDFICDDEDDTEPDAESSDNSSKSFGSGGKQAATARKIKTRNGADNGDSDIEEISNKVEEKDDISEWWKRFVDEKELNNIYHSPKLVILMELLKQCEAIGDKLLVFSQSLQSIDVIEHFLALIDSKTKGYDYEGDVGDFKGCWTNGEDYFRLDGSCSVEQREAMCKKFNDTKNIRARLFLISTRAGGLGINLVAANRVVIFDVSWNPSHDTQSIFRVYRFGQEKPCYIYRLIAMGTMEQKVYERQVLKQATAKRVIDEHQISRHYNQSDLQELYTYELKPTTPREIPILPKDRLFAELLAEHEKILFKYHEHDSLLENEESENLTEAERKAAWSEYEAEKTRTVQTAQFISYDRGAYGVQYGNQTGNVTSNKVFGFRSDVLLKLLNMKVSKDLPGLNENQVTQLVPSYFQRLITEMNNGDPTLYKELLQLHATLAHPSGMYMNPLLYANQISNGPGYFQQPGSGQPAQPGVAVPGPPMVPVTPNPAAPGFEPNQVYEID